MSERIAVRTLCGMLALVLLLALSAVHSSWSEDQTVGIRTEQQISKGVHKKEAEGSLGPKIKQQAPAPDGQAAEKRGEAGDDASEFWPTIFGKRFKITDTFLIFFTGILAWKTWGLDAATRKLWEAGERQIEHIKISANAALKAANAAEQQAFTSIAARLPVLRFISPSLHYVDDIVIGSGPYSSIELHQLPERISIVPSIVIRNDGETDAEMQIIYIGWVTRGYHNRPLYGSTLYIIPPIAAGEIQEFDTGPFHIRLDGEAFSEIRSKRSHLTFYISVEYRDFTGCVWQESAAWVWKQLNGVGAYSFF